MAQFNYKTNRIINGICEWCGVKADNCGHYKDGQSRPLDEAKRLVNGFPPASAKSVDIPPLTKDEQRVVPKPEVKLDEEEKVVATPVSPVAPPSAPQSNTDGVEVEP